MDSFDPCKLEAPVLPAGVANASVGSAYIATIPTWILTYLGLPTKQT